jgi:hypothetical protein
MEKTPAEKAGIDIDDKSNSKNKFKILLKKTKGC